MNVWRERTFRASIVLLVTSAVLIGTGAVGLDANVYFLFGLVVLAGVLAAVGTVLTDLPTVFGYDLGTYASDLWLAPLVAIAFLLVIEPTANPAELRAIGGIAGLIGMANYFVRPLYHYIARHLRNLLETVQGRTAGR